MSGRPNEATKSPPGHATTTRRQALRTVGLIGLGTTLAACSSDSDSSLPTTQPSTTTSSTEEATWAAGGTDLISVDFPTDDIFTTGAACTLVLSDALTEGPCYYAEATGEDISAGRTGLPMQLCLRLIDADCEAVTDHLVEVWHSDTRGLYSGDTSQSADATRFAGDFCTGGDADAESSTFFRGQLISDPSGRVNFRTCFPGWYASRTTHIHIAVSDPSGERRIVSQLCFTDDFVTEVTTNHELYSARGDQDTPLAGGEDQFFPQSDFEQFVLTTERNTDGTLLAHHSIQVL